MEAPAGALPRDRRTLRSRVHSLIDSEAHTRSAAAIRAVMVAAIVLNAAAIVLTTVKSLHAAYGPLFDAMDSAAVMLFALDYAARIWTAPEGNLPDVHSPWGARIAYIASALGIIDLVALLPLILEHFVRN